MDMLEKLTLLQLQFLYDNLIFPLWLGTYLYNTYIVRFASMFGLTLNSNIQIIHTVTYKLLTIALFLHHSYPNDEYILSAIINFHSWDHIAIGNSGAKDPKTQRFQEHRTDFYT